MDIPFKPISIEDRDVITSFTMESELKNCDFSFANMYSWRFLYDSEYAVAGDFLLIRFRIEGKKRLAYMLPVGKGDLGKALDIIEQDSLSQGHPLLLLGITPDAQQQLEAVHPDGFRYIPERNFFDYIYLREGLVGLTGKKYQSKRNHINTFLKKYSYEYRQVIPALVAECLELEQKWYCANRTDAERDKLNNERRSITTALGHFEELGLEGGAICVDGRIVAFSFGSPINHNTFGVHIEKADISYDGAYALINREFAARIPPQYTYVNREEDLGIPGLRQSKLSYHPAFLLEKYTTLKKNNHHP